MKQKDYLTPKCTVLQVGHCSCVCASTSYEPSASGEDFEVDLVEF